MKHSKIALALAGIISASSTAAFAEDTLADAIKNSTTDLNVNLRYEGVSQDNALKDADALTVRTRLTYKTGSYKNLSGVVEFEDSRPVAGMDDYNSTQNGKTSYSVIADPQTTELDQAYLQYAASGFVAKAGRQVIALDNQRFVGHVGWRQDRQTFDAASLGYAAGKFKVDYSYITQRNRIFAQAGDIKSKDNLLNASYTLDFGKVSAYAYLLDADMGIVDTNSTYGLRFAGKAGNEGMFSYQLEYAMQDAEKGTTSNSADYMLAEFGATFVGVTAKLGYEVLGSDDGMYGFSTPLATGHAFNGWSDQFLKTPDQGLADMYVSLNGKVFGKSKWKLVYHDFAAAEASNTVDDLGSEINALFIQPINKSLSAGIKYAMYSAGDSTPTQSYADTDKIWLWTTLKF